MCIRDRLGGEQGNVGKDLPLRIAFAFEATGRGAGFQIGLEPLEHIHFGLILDVYKRQPPGFFFCVPCQGRK